MTASLSSCLFFDLKSCKPEPTGLKESMRLLGEIGRGITHLTDFVEIIIDLEIIMLDADVSSVT